MFIDPSGEYTLAEQSNTIIGIAMLTSIAIYNYSLERTKTKDKSYTDVVYRGLRANENRFLVRFIGIFAKGHYPYTPSQHIEKTRDDTGWISTSKYYGRAAYYARKWVAIINLRRVAKWRILDTTIPSILVGLTKDAQEAAKRDKEVLIWRYINPFAILDVTQK